jgi:hypothetical protein
VNLTEVVIVLARTSSNFKLHTQDYESKYWVEKVLAVYLKGFVVKKN